MAGREGLVDTAVKTSRSGYLQRWVRLSRAPFSHWKPGLFRPLMLAGLVTPLLDLPPCLVGAGQGPILPTPFPLSRPPSLTFLPLPAHLPRCLVKNLESLRVHYDNTVRDNCDGSVVQVSQS